MSSNLEHAITLSLDDYIRKNGVVSDSKTSKAKPDYFKRKLHSEMDNDEDVLFYEDRKGMDIKETECNIKQNSDTASEAQEQTIKSVLLKQESNVVIRRFETVENKRGLKKISSQQWRLRRQNQSNFKPTGTPPLTSVRTIFEESSDQFMNSLSEISLSSRPDARNRINERLRNSRNHKNNRNQYGKDPQMVASFNPTQEINQLKNNIQKNNTGIRDLRPFITPPSSLQTQAPSFAVDTSLSQPNTFGYSQLVTFADMLSRIGQTSSVQERDTFADMFRNVMRSQQQGRPTTVQTMNHDGLAQMSSSELLPHAASSLFNHITTISQNFGPKYDMKVQKNIHELQGKPLLYGSSGVVTMDGPGVDSDTIKPATTDISMNMRFS